MPDRPACDADERGFVSTATPSALHETGDEGVFRILRSMACANRSACDRVVARGVKPRLILAIKSLTDAAHRSARTLDVPTCVLVVLRVALSSMQCDECEARS